MKLELFIKTSVDAIFTRGGYTYSKSAILLELEERATEEFAIGSTKKEILDYWQSLIDDYDIVTEVHKEKAKKLMLEIFKKQ